MRGLRKPPNICPCCWEGPVAARYGLLDDFVEEKPAGDDDAQSSDWSGGYVYTITPAALLFRAIFGCVWCCHLVMQLRGERKLIFPGEPIPQVVGRGPLEIRIGRGREQWDDTSQNTLTAFMIVVNGEQQDYPFAYTMADDPAAAWIEGRVRIADVGSPRALGLAKTCIEQCARDHPRCRALSIHADDSAPLPTRLIDCTDPDRPRIVQPTPGARGGYAALSYVWGEEQPHRTTVANLASYMREGIESDTLPQTIRDAIHVAHALGMRFLWVDSLCIVQDSREDKHRELRCMRDIYRHAYFTIDALAAKTVSAGFLQDRRPLKPVATLPFICPPSSVDLPRLGTIYLSPTLSDYNPDLSDILTILDPALSYTLDRAWCLQETLMSTRTLIFTSETVQLGCQTLTQNVGGAQINTCDTTRGPRRLPDAMLRDRDPLQAVPGSQAWADIHDAWRRVVTDYSARRLSCATDKLTACAGLAELVGRALCVDYVAGLWRDERLLRSLMWYRPVPWDRWVEARGRPSAYRAPSWSWASLDDEVAWLEDSGLSLRTALVEVVKCTVTLKDESLPYGEVTDGSLVLRAQIYPCKWHPRTSSCHLMPKRPDRHQSPPWAAMMTAEQHAKMIEALIRSRNPHIEYDADGVLVGKLKVMLDHLNDAEVRDRDVWVVPLWWGLVQVRVQPKSEISFMTGLVLTREDGPYGPADAHHRCENRDPHAGRNTRYRRVGIFHGSNVAWRAWDSYIALPPAVEIEIV
ncbi:heterokaryon incompatibility protein-domain-containing protein [Cubamyces menziesii]|nr:heterokaryon incompatibility protein-domain-containing protein [Cubamyces menziesii]